MDYESLFTKITAAIIAHPRLELLPGVGPEMVVHSWKRKNHTARIRIKLRGSSKKPRMVYASGDSFDEAVTNLIKDLNYWADTFESSA